MLAAATAGLALSSGFSGFSASRSAVQVRSTDAAMMSRTPPDALERGPMSPHTQKRAHTLTIS